VTRIDSSNRNNWDEILNGFAAKIGANKMLTQGPGGNISYKDGSQFWIKASGMHLKDALNRQIFVGLDLHETRRNIENGVEHFPNRYGDFDNGLRSSIETSMHAQIEAPFVAHVHSVGAVSMSLLLDQSRAIRTASQFCKVSYAPYVRPGIELARVISEVIEPDSRAVLLGNHGLTVWGESSSECIGIIENLERIWAEEFEVESSKLTDVDNSWAEVLSKGILVPDEVVFLGKNPFHGKKLSEDVQELLSPFAKEKYDESDWISDFVEVLSIVAKNVRNFEGVRYLNSEEIAELVNWDAEKFRQGSK
jgi:rhamnose utilization protein RhaD (predicted bifunctional aldolase and dehydrogenase)